MIRFNPFERKSKNIGMYPGAYEEVLVKGDVSLRVIDYTVSSYTDETVKTNFKDYVENDEDNTLLIASEGVNKELSEAINSRVDIGAIHLENLSIGLGKASIHSYDEYEYAELPFYRIDDRRLYQVPVRFLFWRTNVLVCYDGMHLDFSNIADRIIQSKGRVRKMGPDYLFFIVIDYLLDHAIALMNEYNQKIGLLEEFEELDKHKYVELLDLRRQLLRISADYFSFQSELKQYIAHRSDAISKDSIPYFEDLQQHVDAFLIKTEILINRTDSIKDLHVNNISLRSNAIMQMLTVLSTIFLPITFLTGLYGMNFEFIPELKFQYGYFILLGVCVSVSIALLIYFKKKGWL